MFTAYRHLGAPYYDATDRGKRPAPHPMLCHDPRWMWAICGNVDCQVQRAIALVPFVIRWGAACTGDRIRRTLRCTRCGHKGVLLQHPSYSGSVTQGYGRMPVD